MKRKRLLCTCVDTAEAVLAGCLLLLVPELLTMGVLAYCLGSLSKSLVLVSSVMTLASAV